MIEDSNFQTYQAKLDPTLRVTHDSLVPLEHNGFGVAQGQFNWLQWQNQFILWLNPRARTARCTTSGSEPTRSGLSVRVTATA